MADEQTPDEAPAKSSGKKTIMIVAVLMVLEAGAVFFLVSMTTGGQDAGAEVIEGIDEADQEFQVEIKLAEDKFQNLQSGRVWLYETEIFVKVRNKNLDHVNRELENRSAEIQEGVALVFRRAQPHQLREPGLETITRQLGAYANDVFGTDVDGMPRVDRIIIPKCKGFPADF